MTTAVLRRVSMTQTTNPAAADQAGKLFQKAIDAQRQGRMPEARRLLDEVLALVPGQPQALNMHGMLALQAGDIALALRNFEQAVEADPKEPALWINIATAQRALRNDEGERTALQQALDIDLRNIIAQLRMAELQERLGEHQNASDSWSRVVALVAMLDNVPQGLAEASAHGRDYVERHRAQFASVIEQGLTGELSVADETTQRRFQACLDREFGRRTIYANQCSGIHYPFLPADEYFDRKHFPWFEALEAKTDAIRREFLALYQGARSEIRPYVRQDPGTPENKWTPLNESLDWGACFLWEYGVRNETVCALCPETAAAIDAIPRADIPGRSPSAFFSLLKPNSHIPPHTGVTNTRAIIHLPLIVPTGCAFRVGGETRVWEEGRAFAFDDSIDHEAWNNSDDLRVILILDVWNPHLSVAEQQLLRQFYHIADANRQ